MGGPPRLGCAVPAGRGVSPAALDSIATARSLARTSPIAGRVLAGGLDETADKVTANAGGGRRGRRQRAFAASLRKAAEAARSEVEHGDFPTPGDDW